MPGGDRTGPTGDGPLTGRGAGYCGGRDAPGWTETPHGRRRRRRNRGGGGQGFGRGRGFGWGRRAGDGLEPAPGAEDDPALLRAESKRLRARMKSIERRLKELEESN